MEESAGGWRFSRGVIAPVIVSILIIFGLLAATLRSATAASNSISVARQILMVRQALDIAQDQVVQDQAVVAVWNDLVAIVRRGNGHWSASDMTFLEENVSNSLHDDHGHDQTYILDRADRAIYAVADRRQLPLSAYARIAPSLATIVAEVRGRGPPRGYAHDRLTPASRATLTASGIVIAKRAVYASHLVRITGRPAIASVMRIVPHSDAEHVRPGDEALLVSIRFLDRRFLAELTRRNLLQGLRLSGRFDARPSERALAIVSEDGTRIGWLFWRPELPGRLLLTRLLPIALLAAIAILILFAILIVSLRRSTRQLQAEEALSKHLANSDSLTGLHNRSHFVRQLDDLLGSGAARAGCAVLLIDLDRFKQVNDTLGHPAGDLLLVQFSRRLSDAIRSCDSVARLGGDEFAILIEQAADSAAIADICGRILASTALPFDLNNTQAFVGASIGVAIASPGGEERGELMRKADIALYEAKAQGRNRWCLFNADMDALRRERAEIETELRHELRLAVDGEASALSLHYQLKISRDGAVTGVEALLRWRNLDQRRSSPDLFIPIAEESGLILPLGDWVLAQAFAFAARWPDLPVAVNISPSQLRSSRFAERVMELAHSAGVESRRIELEVTESILLEGFGTGVHTLNILRNAGFRVALDDFGTGYSSLGHLQDFAVDRIKIDRSFVQHLGQRTESNAIIQAMVLLGHAVGLQVTAEGVETADQKALLQAAGCDELQGFVIAAPVAEAELGSALLRHRSTFDPAGRSGSLVVSARP